MSAPLIIIVAAIQAFACIFCTYEKNYVAAFAMAAGVLAQISALLSLGQQA